MSTPQQDKTKIMWRSEERGIMFSMEEKINLVNTKGERIGEIEKMEAHEKGLLHEAFSIFIFNEQDETLLQKRALAKYHSGGLWTNTCCSHARVGEHLIDAAHRRLKEELGFDTNITQVHAFVYKTDRLASGLVEHEYDYIFTGRIDKQVRIVPNPEEVAECKWVALPALLADVASHPEQYTEWFKIILRDGLLGSKKDDVTKV